MSEPERSLRLKDRVVVITGAGRGIGRAYALAMARHGARLIVNDLGTDLEGREQDAGPADRVVAEIEALGGQAVSSAADVADPKGAEAIMDTARRAYGRVDALVNNAAIEFRGSFEEHSAAIFDRVMAVNVGGSFNCVRAALPMMREQGGGVVLNTTSGSSWEGTEGVAAYSASKAAVLSLTLTQHTELAKYGIASNCLSPGATRTRMLDAWLSQMATENDRGEAYVLEAYGIQPAENLAPLAVYLCSEAGRMISGQVFEVADDRIVSIAPPRREESIVREGAAWTVDEVSRRLSDLIS